MLNLKKVLGAKPKEHTQANLKPLLTPWGETLDTAHVLEEHPDPQFARTRFQVLNGTWQCAFMESGHAPTDDLESIVRTAPTPAAEAFDADIVVPFSPEAALSGVNRQLQPDKLLWYRRTFEPPMLEEGMRLLLHFQAVDYACAVYVNGQLVGSHVGGYIPFGLDITESLKEDRNELAVCVADPSEFGNQLRGKQRFDRGDIWYTAQSGIWQTVWMETVPAKHIVSARIEPDAETGILAIGFRLSEQKLAPDAATDDSKNPSLPPVVVEVFDANGALVASETCAAYSPTCAMAVHVPDKHLWSPDDPYRYRLRFTYGSDEVESYCAFRTIELRRDEHNRPRVFLNGKPLFIKGILDQAYWPDGLMTAPADEALVFDIEAMRDAGFNLMRKHIKVESARWYYHCDRLGMLVLQDMVSGGDAEIHTWQWSYKPTLFKLSWAHYSDTRPAHQAELGGADARYQGEWTSTCRNTVELLGNHPCIIGWSLFNEGWGQFNARAACQLVRHLDPTRVIDAVSGWFDQGCGDFKSQHNYFRDLRVWPCRKGRAYFVSEFGGYTHRVEGHSALDEAYGYEPYEDIDEWRQAVRDVLAHMDSLEPRGLAGYIYTQVSDIEEETNGLLTYDRRVNKLDS